MLGRKVKQVNFTTSGMRSEELANHLWEQGYRQVSRRYRLLAKVDIKDLRGFFKRQMVEGGAWYDALGKKSVEEHYRRCYSKDIIEVQEHIMKQIRSKENRELIGLPLPVPKSQPGFNVAQYKATKIVEKLIHEEGFEFVAEDARGTVLCKAGVTVIVSVNKEISCLNCEWKGDLSECEHLEGKEVQELLFCPKCKRIIVRKDSG